MVTGHVAVLEDGKSIGTMYPGRWFYRKHEEQPTTQVAIRRSVAEDLYLVMPAYDLKDQSISLQIVINPLVSWIWIGGIVMTAGALLALAPRLLVFSAAAPVPAQVAGQQNVRSNSKLKAAV